MARNEKPIRWIGSALDDLLAFPVIARREAGFQLRKVQVGLLPENWKPLVALGAGVREIRIRDDLSAFRVVYVAKFDDAVYVLHCFQKKTQATSRRDREIVVARYRTVTMTRKGAQ